MAGFGRSNSLSINTSGSLFGNNASTPATQGQQSAGLFGSTANNAASTSQPQAGGLFGAANTSQPAQTGSLFGATNSTSQPQQSGGLFGGLNSKPATTGTTGTSLFGASTAASQPQQSGGLFGSTLGGNTTAQNQTTSQSGGLFGSKPSLFGASTQQTNTAPSLFGNTNTQQNQPAAPSLFGNTTTQTQPQQQGSLFGGMAPQNQANQSAQGAIQLQDFASVRGTTRFHELNQDLQQRMQLLDNTFLAQMNDAKRITETLPKQGDLVASLSPDVAYIENHLSTVELGIDNDSASISRLKEMNTKDIEDAALVFRAATNLTLPSQFHYRNTANLTSSSTRPTTTSNTSADDDDPTKPVDLVPYFSKRVTDLSSTLELYQRQIREIEAHLRTMEAGTMEKYHQLQGARSGVRDQRRELVDALRAIEGAILELARKVGKTRDAVTVQTLGSVGGVL